MTAKLIYASVGITDYEVDSIESNLNCEFWLGGSPAELENDGLLHRNDVDGIMIGHQGCPEMDLSQVYDLT